MRLQIYPVCLLFVIAVFCTEFGYSTCCDSGWFSFQNHCYFFNHDKQGQADWNDADKTCKFLGGYLVDIRSEDERRFVVSHLRRGSERIDQYMIGVSDSNKEGNWVYTVDDQPVTFLKWYISEPNGGKSENCGSLFTDKDYLLGMANDTGCNVKLGRFICKKTA